MRLITADMPEANDIRVWLNFKEVTRSTFMVELGKWPYLPTWSSTGMYVLDERGGVMSESTEIIDGEVKLKEIHRRGLVWWTRRRSDK